MCGIAGFINNYGYPLSHRKAIASRMAEILRHRGPDAQNVWADPKSGVTFAHTRLAIIDLSPAGAQPMHSASGRYVIIFNGEIYNFLDIRHTLENQHLAPAWRGHSDTEVLLAAFEVWGVRKTLASMVGMFAFALWDRHQQVLYLARDRMGEKPLYYGVQGRTFLFASELKALKVHPEFRGEIDRQALTLYFRHNYIPAPYSIYQGIFKLPPGTFLEVTVQNGSFALKKHTYWSLEEVVSEGQAHPFEGDEEEALAELERLLRQSLQGQMIADVPLGAFLSGGIDSSTIVALMQAISPRPIRTFSIGFQETEYNEAPFAKAVAKHLGTDHTEMYVTPAEALEVIPHLPTIYDEPFSDSSQIPTFLLSRLTRRHVTVSLSGDAGDELFAGYNRYFLALRLWKTLEQIPFWLRNSISQGLLAVPLSAWKPLLALPNLGLKTLQKLKRYPGGMRWHLSGRRVRLLATLIRQPTLPYLYHHLVSHFKDPAVLVLQGQEPKTVFSNDKIPVQTAFALMQYLDQQTYLPDDILVKVDRAAMAVSLETRIPLLDHRIVEFTWRLPESFKVHQGKGKWLLRRLLYKYVPPHLIERPKHGFGVPIDYWLREPLRDWAEALLNEQRLRQEGFLNPRLVRSIWHEHLTGRAEWHYYLWDILMFQAWLEKEKEWVR